MAQHLTSLKRTPDKSRHDELTEQSKPFFPLSWHVSTEEIEKLGLSGKELGDELMLVAKVRVTGISANEQEGSEKFESMTLDLIEGAIEAPKKDQASILFGKKDE